MNDVVQSSETEPRQFCQPHELNRSLITDAEKQAALQAIDRAIEKQTAFDRYGGEEVDAFEKEFAEHMGVKFATAVSSGTAAVHAALASLQLEPGSEVICPPITDPGGISPVLFQMCIPVFADTHPSTFNVDPAAVEAAITEKTAAIVAAHIAGEPCQMDALLQIAAKHNLPLIEDAAQAHDATWDGHKVGSLGTMGAFSLMSGKHHTAGGQGGMVTTNDESLYWKVKSFADRGKSFGREDLGGCMGLNYRMTELEAAIGRVQLQRLPEIVGRRQERAAQLQARLEKSKVFSLGHIPAKAQSAYWFLRTRVELPEGAPPKTEVAARLRARGLRAAPTYTSIIYSQPWFRNRASFGTSGLPWTLPGVDRDYAYDGCCPRAEQALADHLLIAFNESVNESTIDRMAEAMLEVEQGLAR